MKKKKKLSDDFLKALLTQTVVGDYEIKDYIPRYVNPAINFATEDMGFDEAMGGVHFFLFLYSVGVKEYIFLKVLQK